MEERHVQWSPDGQALIYALETARGVYELEQIDFNSGVRQRLTEVTGTDVETADLNPIPSPLLTAEALAQLDNRHPLLPSAVRCRVPTPVLTRGLDHVCRPASQSDGSAVVGQSLHLPSSHPYQQ